MTWASQAYNPGSNPGDRIGLYRIIIQNDRLAYKNIPYNVVTYYVVQISKVAQILTPIEENRPKVILLPNKQSHVLKRCIAILF